MSPTRQLRQGRVALRLRFVTKYRIKLLPSHISLSHVRKVATSTLANGGFSSSLFVWHRVMAKGEVSPTIRLSESFIVLHRRVNPV